MRGIRCLIFSIMSFLSQKFNCLFSFLSRDRLHSIED